MSMVTRGTRNAFRNGVRTGSIILILAISIGLALVMLLSMRAVNARINSVKSSIANTITVTPAGERGFAGGGNPLTTAQVNEIKAVPHVTGVTASLNDRLSNSNSTSSFSFPGSGSGGTTNLVSPINPGRAWCSLWWGSGRRTNLYTSHHRYRYYRPNQHPSSRSEPT